MGNKPKLTQVQKAEMRDLHATGKYSFYQLGKIFGVSHTMARNTVKKKRHK